MHCTLHNPHQGALVVKVQEQAVPAGGASHMHAGLACAATWWTCKVAALLVGATRTAPSPVGVRVCVVGLAVADGARAIQQHPLVAARRQLNACSRGASPDQRSRQAGLLPSAGRQARRVWLAGGALVAAPIQ
jgi:hypothetical protein